MFDGCDLPRCVGGFNRYRMKYPVVASLDAENRFPLFGAML
jgi:hypothetical protein